MRKLVMRRALPALLCAVALSVAVLAAPTETGGSDGAEGTQPYAALETPDIEYERRETGFAADYDYSGVLDQSTGLPTTGTGMPLSGGTGLVSLSDTMSYDMDHGRYVCTVSDGSFLCTAADGMIVTQPVSIDAADAAISVYRDGAAVPAEEYQNLSAPGEYAVYAGTGESGRRAMTFTIVGGRTNQIYGYSVPEGFFVRDAALNGEAIGFDRYFVDMESEGEYRIEYRCPAADLTYTLELTIDRTPPELAVGGRLGKDGRVHSAVTFSVVGESGTISITRDGEPYKAPMSVAEGRLTEPGTYELVITDEAGNSMSYDFVIVVYLDSNSVLFILLVLAAIVSVAGLAIWKRKNFRTY